MSDQIIVTVYGVDNVGIVAKVTATLAELTVNIEDIKTNFNARALCNVYAMQHIKIPVFIQRNQRISHQMRRRNGNGNLGSEKRNRRQYA